MSDQKPDGESELHSPVEYQYSFANFGLEFTIRDGQSTPPIQIPDNLQGITLNDSELKIISGLNDNIESISSEIDRKRGFGYDTSKEKEHLSQKEKDLRWHIYSQLPKEVALKVATIKQRNPENGVCITFSLKGMDYKINIPGDDVDFEDKKPYWVRMHPRLQKTA